MSVTIMLRLSSLVSGVVGTSPSVYVASFAPYPGYSGEFRVRGAVTITAGGASTIAKQKLTWTLTGVDTACTMGAAQNVQNGCGIHVHTGKSCDVAGHVGGHYYDPSLDSDPWAPVVYVSTKGSSTEEVGIEVATGLTNEDIIGRALVVHELNSGRRIACGVVGTEAPSTCTGYSAGQANTDISGFLLAKVWSPNSGRCCSLCDARSDCEGYVFHLDQCYLKKDLGTTSYKQYAVTRVKALSNCAGYTPQMKDIDMSGVLLAKIQVSDPKRCCVLCDAFPGCEGYVFHLDECYLKKELSSPIHKSGAMTQLKFGAGFEQMSTSLVTSLRGSRPASLTQVEGADSVRADGVALSACVAYGAGQENVDISGVLLAKVWSPNSGRCCSLCDARSDCEGYVFHLDQCYLKKDLGTTSYKQYAVTRVKALSNCAGYAPQMKDIDMSGVLLAKIQVSDPKRCCALCDAFAGCEGYVFHLDECYLKKEFTVPAHKPQAITRMRLSN